MKLEFYRETNRVFAFSIVFVQSRSTTHSWTYANAPLASTELALLSTEVALMSTRLVDTELSG